MNGELRVKDMRVPTIKRDPIELHDVKVRSALKIIKQNSTCTLYISQQIYIYWRMNYMNIVYIYIYILVKKFSLNIDIV